MLDQAHRKDDQLRHLQEQLDALNAQLSVARHQMGLMYEEVAAERADWTVKAKAAEEENARLYNESDANGIKADEFEQHLKIIQGGGKV